MLTLVAWLPHYAPASWMFASPLVCFALLVLLLAAQRRRASHRDRRRLLEMELRLEAAWKDTKSRWAVAGLPLLHDAASRVLSVRGGSAAQETVQQTQVSCDIYED